MQDNPAKKADEKSRYGTTGHEWDGIQELNTPLPRWWLWTWYACILWAFGYWIAYPAIPLVSSFTKGALGWSSREAVVADIAGLQTLRGPMTAKIEAASLTDIEKTPELLSWGGCARCKGLSKPER